MSDTEYYYPDEGSIFSRRHRRSHSPAVSNSSIDSSPNPYIRFKRPNAARYEMVPFEKCRTFEVCTFPRPHLFPSPGIVSPDSANAKEDLT
jgi:hypothetical protein